jgi:2-oxoglutarate ferredoxin oxidoreductase subunit gamma
MFMRLTELRIAGFGGQGVMLAANIIGKAAAIYGGGYATMTQNYGPEARGGASSGQLVLSGEPILYPYTTNPDVLVVLSQEAYTRFAPEMNPNGLLLVEQDLVRLDDIPGETAVYSIPATRMAEELGKKIVMNIIVVGFFAAITQLLPKEAYLQAVSDSVPAAHRELNLRAFEKGYEYALRGAPHSESMEEIAESAIVE